MMLKCLPPIVNGTTGLLQQSTTEGVKPSPSISFGILKGVKKDLMVIIFGGNTKVIR